MSNPHICLVSAQLLPNLIPATVHLVVTDDMPAQAARLERILRHHGIAAVQHRGAPSTGMADIRGFAENMAVQLDGQGPFLLNATGGTKLMALAFVQVIPELLPGTEVLYTDTDHQRLEFLSSRESPALPIQSVIRLDTYLHAYGLQRQSALSSDAAWLTSARRLKPLSKHLARHIAEHQGFIGALNNAAEQAIGGPDRAFRARQKLEAHGRSKAVLAEIARPEYGLLEIVSDDCVAFASDDAARYLGGGWMEHYGWWTLRDAGAEEAEAGVQVLWLDGDRHNRPPNELDVVAVHRNRLLLIECKTARFGNKDVRDQEILNRLESLGRNAGGLFGKAVLLSARRLSDDMRSRAQAYHLPWFDPDNFKNFHRFVKDWLAG
jgi:hypothetical protein